jgi:ElaB/YqjD/DUF883 family membrane-anchored ribosome-binding protein
MGHRRFRPTPLEAILAPRRGGATTTLEWRGQPGEPKPLWAILGEAPPYDWRPSDVVVPLAPRDTTAPTPEPDIPSASDNRYDAETGRFVDDLAEGAKSWFRGIGRAGDQVLDAIGASNAQDQAAALRANRTALDALQQAAAHPRETREIIRQGVPPARDYIGEHPGVVGGRVGAGAAIGAMTNPYVAGSLSLLAIYGDVLHAIRNGAQTYDDIVRSVLGGESPGQP